MTDGPVHEVGETARSVVNSLGASPMTLAMVVVNIALIGLLYFDMVHGEKERIRSLELLYENRKYVGDVLARCNFIPKP